MTESASAVPGLPVPLPPRLQAAYDELGAVGRQALVAHLTGGTSAEALAAVLRDNGIEVSASTIRTYRRRARQAGV